MNIALGRSLIKSMAGKKYKVSRSRGGEYVNGYWVESERDEVEILASIQPLSGKETLNIPEGDRNRERRKIYSADELRVGLQSNQADADIITIDDKQWEVETVEAWPQYWKCIIVTVEPPERDEG